MNIVGQQLIAEFIVPAFECPAAGRIGACSVGADDQQRIGFAGGLGESCVEQVLAGGPQGARERIVRPLDLEIRRPKLNALGRITTTFDKHSM